MGEVKRSYTKLSRTQFVFLVDIMRKSKAYLLENRPNQQETAVYLANKAGFHVGHSVVNEVKDAAGFSWNAKHRGVESMTAKKSSIPTLVLCLHRLYKRLGEDVPQELQELVDKLESKENTKQP